MESLHPFFRYLLQTFGFFFYLVLGGLIVAIAILFKVSAIILADKYLYNILFLGDLLRGIEIIELLNILVFAMLGMVFGIAAALLPRKIGRQVSAVLLIILVPIVFITTPIARYYLWLEKVGADSGLDIEQTEVIGNSFFLKKVGVTGFVGFYLYTGKFPVLPAKKSEMIEMERLEKSVNSRFVRLTGIPPTVINWLMILCFWLIRVFYFLIAVFATINHFHQGLKLAKR
jgi:hypothetical protein